MDRIIFQRSPYFTQLWLGTHVHAGLLPRRVQPIAASLKLTENCQAKCVTCDYWKTHWLNHLDTENAVKTINRLGELGVRYLRFTGGEPLLRKDFFEVLERANTSQFRQISIQTNGLLLTRKAEEINRSPITKVSVSLDGMETTNDQIRGIPGYFRLALDGLRLLKNKRLQIAVTLNQLSANELEQMIEMARDLGAGFGFNLLDNHLYFFKDVHFGQLVPKGDGLAAIVTALRGKMRLPRYEWRFVEDYYSDRKLKPPPCILGFLEFHVASNGDLLSGCYVLEPMGNILQDDVGKILQREAYRRRCVSMVKLECPGCSCGVRTSLALQHATATILHQIGPAPRRAPRLGRLAERADSKSKAASPAPGA